MTGVELWVYQNWIDHSLSWIPFGKTIYLENLIEDTNEANDKDNNLKIVNSIDKIETKIEDN